MKQKRANTRRRSRGSRESKIEGTGWDSPWSLVIVFFFLTSIFLFLRSPFFSVRNYVINGANRVPHEEIIARCSQKSANAFDLDLDKMEKAIQSSPWIKEVRCVRKFPDTIVIDVVERKPVVFAPVGGKIWLVDDEGQVLQEDDRVLGDLSLSQGPEFWPGRTEEIRMGPQIVSLELSQKSD